MRYERGEVNLRSISLSLVWWSSGTGSDWLSNVFQYWVPLDSVWVCECCPPRAPDSAVPFSFPEGGAEKSKDSILDFHNSYPSPSFILVARRIIVGIHIILRPSANQAVI